ncbi:hypothetical protein [Paracoccus sp. ME4]|uniref:hypothetical protein n=1 Tax=Paracoccus sp. ME4 TaxID=3138066 RepID=UPI00398B56ED
MKKIVSSICAAAVAVSMLPQGASAGSWANVAQANNIISQLRTLNQNTKSVGDNVKDVERQVENSVKEAADRIIAALRNHSGEQSAYQDKQIEASRRITDAAEMNQTQRMRQEFRAKAESGAYDPNPGLCLLSGLYRDDGSAPETPRGSTTVAAAKALANGADPAVQEGTTARDSRQFAERKALASAMGSNDATADVAAILQNPTITMETENDRRAAERLVRNLVDPVPPVPVTSNEIVSAGGLARAAARTRQETRNSTSGEVIAMLMNMRTQVGDTEPWQPYLDDISNYNRPVGDRLSELQQIDIRTLRHYAPKPEVFQERAAWSDRQLLQEILDVQSINTRIAFLQLELDSRRAAVETQMLSIMNNGK